MDNFNINESLGYLIGKTNSLMRNQFNKLIKENGNNATSEQWGILNIINEFPGIIQSEIAQKGLKDKTNITRMLDLLEKNGYVERKPSKTDRRLYKIFITDTGKKLLDEIIPIAIEVNKMSVSVLNENEVSIFISLLKKINNNLLNKS
ncbi:MAG: MarR family transcriptional regulator [Bacteroidetes bacterium]|nr:MarR family transcriptional regulator [Bacteroidota bacterium]